MYPATVIAPKLEAALRPIMKLHWALLVLALPAPAQPVPGFSVDVHLVRVPCVVTDKTGVPTAGLRREDFAVLEDGSPREIKYLWQESDLPLTIGLVVDVSGTQARFIEEHRYTVMQFLERVLSGDDRAFIVRVEVQQRLVTDLTSSIDELRAGTEALIGQPAEILGEACTSARRVFGQVVLRCTSPIWNGIFFAAHLKLRPQPGRKAMLLLSDGWDMGSQHTLSDAIKACQSADTMVYTVRYFDMMPATPLPSSKRIRERFSRTTQRDLERLSNETGGRLYDGESTELSTIFKSIETDLRTQYVVGYTQPKAPRKGYHRITVKVRRPGLVVRARQGYYAE